jgi:hypothetical protein
LPSIDGEQHNGAFDTMDVELTAHSGVLFQNLDSGFVGSFPATPASRILSSAAG